MRKLNRQLPRLKLFSYSWVNLFMEKEVTEIAIARIAITVTRYTSGRVWKDK
jgi:hypothetical protein